MFFKQLDKEHVHLKGNYVSLTIFFVSFQVRLCGACMKSQLTGGWGRGWIQDQLGLHSETLSQKQISKQTNNKTTLTIFFSRGKILYNFSFFEQIFFTLFQETKPQFFKIWFPPSLYFCAEWGYIVTFRKVLTMYQQYHTWISHLPLLPFILLPPTHGTISASIIFAFTCMCTHFLHLIHSPIPCL
jgi:hypothetical protein